MLECRKADLGENQGTVLEYEWRMRAWGGGGSSAALALFHSSFCDCQIASLSSRHSPRRLMWSCQTGQSAAP